MDKCRFHSLNPHVFAYFAKQWSLYDFGVFLCSIVAMAQFPILSISPAEHLEETISKIIEKLYL